MKPGIFFSIVILLLLGSSACTRELKSSPYAGEIQWDSLQGTTSADASTQLAVKTYVIEHITPDYDKEAGTGAYIHIRYDQIVNPTPALDDSVNQHILAFIRGVFDPQKELSNATPEQIAGALIRRYRSRTDKTGNTGIDYQVECRIRQPYPGLIAVECNDGSYSGAAHPRYTGIYNTYLVQDMPGSREKMFSNTEPLGHIADKIMAGAPAASLPKTIDRFSQDDLFAYRNDTIIFTFHDMNSEPEIIASSQTGFFINPARGMLKKVS